MEIDPGAQPVRSTRWCVITGAPSSGKTAVILDLERRGFRVVHEAARAYIEQELEKGRRLQEVKSDRLHFEFEEKFVARHQTRLESCSSRYDTHVIEQANHVYTFDAWQRELLHTACAWLSQHFPVRVDLSAAAVNQ